jgi:hypothetical protein
MDELSFLDLSEDGEYIVFGNNENLILTKTIMLLPKNKIKEEKKFSSIKIEGL